MKDEKYMKMALALGEKGKGFVEPNPAVGCVIVKDDQVIGKGFHEQFGQAHAEINAIADCRENGFETKGAVMYVTLEPCCHKGKTGPCTEALIEAGISKIYIATSDPSENVGGRGIECLRQANIEVIEGICWNSAEMLNPWFYKFSGTKLPWVIVKWAQSKDGFLAYKNPDKDGQWISSQSSREDVHKIRRQAQGILVGINTVIADNPLLTARPDNGRQPVRIILDSNLRIPIESKVVNNKDARTIVVTTEVCAESNPDILKSLRDKECEIAAVKNKQGLCDMGDTMKYLGKIGIAQLLVEGGVRIITTLLEGGYADEARIYISPDKLGEKGAAPASKIMQELINEDRLFYVKHKQMGSDKCINGFLNNLTTS